MEKTFKPGKEDEDHVYICTVALKLKYIGSYQLCVIGPKIWQVRAVRSADM